MYFKPRIFISSTLDLPVREKVDKFLKSVGADTMLYEINLTPSTIPSTYRYDILEADFVIFILDKKYGTKTENDISGTHEEWNIISETKIPKHVYVHKADKDEVDEELKGFIKGIKDAGISYFYYHDDDDLLRKLSETTFTIAKEIALNKVEQLKLPEKSIRGLALEFDYNHALELIKIVEQVKTYLDSGLIDLYGTTILTDTLGLWGETSHSNTFIDPKLNEMLEEILIKYNQFYNIHAKYFNSYHSRRSINILGIRIEVLEGRFELNSNDDQFSEIRGITHELFTSFNAFRDYVFEKRKAFAIDF